MNVNGLCYATSWKYGFATSKLFIGPIPSIDRIISTALMDSDMSLIPTFALGCSYSHSHLDRYPYTPLPLNRFVVARSFCWRYKFVILYIRRFFSPNVRFLLSFSVLRVPPFVNGFRISI